MVTIHRAPLAPAIHLDHLTDSLNGLNVRPANYLHLTPLPEKQAEPRYPWEDYQPFECWLVFVWEDGLDYNEDGTPYQDDAPGDFCASHHRTRKGAEAEAAWMEHHGISADRISIRWGWTSEYDYNYPLRD